MDIKRFFLEELKQTYRERIAAAGRAEQGAGEAVDHRADLYALGVTLFQLCTGSLPFEDGDVSYRHRHEAPPDPRELNVRVPAELADLLLQLLAKSPDERPQSASEVSQRLSELLAANAERTGS